MVLPPASSFDAQVVAWHRASLQHDMATGQAMQAVFPLYFIGPFIVPILWIATPHTRSTAAHPLLAHGATKWAVALACFACDVAIVRAHMTTQDILLAYGCGLMAAFGFLMTFRFIVVMDPQEEAARVIRVKRRTGGDAGVHVGGKASVASELRRRTNANSTATPATPPAAAAEAGEEQYDYYWQPFPADAPLSQRLNWSIDLYSSLRGSGWTWGPQIVPQPPPPQTPITRSKALQPVSVSSIPMRTKYGFTRPASPSAFMKSTLARYAVTYVLSDVFVTLMRHDPYFAVGPGYRQMTPPPATPAFFQLVPEWALDACRPLVLFLYVAIGLNFATCMVDVMQYVVLGYAIPIRREPWMYASFFGGFDQVLDRGLAGFWGAWWHQSLRVVFTGPTEYLVRLGYVSSARGSRGALVCNLVFPFLLSGIVHACASSTMPGPTDVRGPLAFFALSGLGTGLQMLLGRVLAPVAGAMPRWARRAASFAFVFSWLMATGWLFADDMASSGFLLNEPVTVSFARLAGLGREGDPWLRPSRKQVWWHRGRRWWQSGLAM